MFFFSPVVSDLRVEINHFPFFLGWGRRRGRRRRRSVRAVTSYKSLSLPAFWFLSKPIFHPLSLSLSLPLRICCRGLSLSLVILRDVVSTFFFNPCERPGQNMFLAAEERCRGASDQLFVRVCTTSSTCPPSSAEGVPNRF